MCQHVAPGPRVSGPAFHGRLGIAVHHSLGLLHIHLLAFFQIAFETQHARIWLNWLYDVFQRILAYQFWQLTAVDIDAHAVGQVHECLLADLFFGSGIFTAPQQKLGECH